MKTVLIYLVAASIALISSVSSYAQDNSSIGQDIKKGAKKTGHAIKQGAKKAGNKTAELASKGKSAVVDKVYDGKQGPQGQTIYINDQSQYYWVDKKGRHHFVGENELKDKNN